MATYFHGASEIHPEGLQTLYLMNPGYVGYADAAGSPAENMIFLNSGINSLAHTMSGPPPPQQHFLGFPPPSHHNLWSPATPVSNSFGHGTHQQGLSLSLSSQQTPPYGYRTEEITASVQEMAPPAGIQSVLMNSKYLKVARELLDEMASVGSGGGAESAKKAGEKSPAKYRKETNLKGHEGESCGKRETEVTTAERQDLHMRKAKLLGMLDEVEQRYNQYHHQMRIIVSSFDAVAGHGAAKAYTALALQTISKQFRCLRDAISGEIRTVGRNLGEEDCCPAQGGGKSIGSRLRLVDHQLRQQRALQQLGMMQPNGWRPQRGLPERAVSILRAWLFEHFLHPYPKDSDKLMLAKQTGLTRSQVSNWFINARVRLWKPMVEEMYVEEIKEQEKKNRKKNDDHAEKTSFSRVNVESTSKASSQTKTEHNDDPNPSNYSTPISQTRCEEILGQQQPFSKKARPAMMKSPREIAGREILMKFNGGSNFGAAYSVEDNVDEHFAPRFHGNGAVSLTLGLPHCDFIAGAEPPFLAADAIAGAKTSQQASHAANSYGRIEIQNSNRFAAQLLPDFVA
ncbi:BEL1-like homeodomain protein 1 [Platanthera guangdongensis]|uniref:BEL1-like homeodomain protein 1 n=1 Tax=Platanthera guangdongensis TaxID=2320717 RepID=A0ABR2MV98_9ASPA